VTPSLVTFFPGVRTPVGRRALLSDDALTRFVSEPRSHDCDKLALPLWSPATFAEDRRLLSHVEHVSLFVIDVDTLHTSTEVFLARLVDALPGVGLWVHTSYSSQPGALRFRAFAKYERPVTSEEHRGVFGVTAMVLANAGVSVDGACKDASRGYFVPAQATGGVYAWRALTGEALPMESALEAHRRLVEAERAATRHHAATSLTSGDERRALAYIERVPGAFAGQRGHDHTFNLALKLVKGFGLSSDRAYALMAHWNARCHPPWSAKELKRKIEQAEAGRLPQNFMEKANR
jgi:hypothetical protein